MRSDARSRARFRGLLPVGGKVSIAALLALALWRIFADLDLQGVLDSLSAIGPGAVLLLVPYAFMVLADSAGWAFCLGLPWRFSRVGALYLIRLATEALTNSLPGGAAVADSTRVYLLHERLGVGMPEGAASCYLARLNLIGAHMMFGLLGVLLLAGSLGFAAVPGTLLPLAMVPVMALLLVLAYTGPRLTQALDILGTLGALRTLLERARPFVSRVDGYVQIYGRTRAHLLGGSIGAFLLGWVMLSAETFLLLHALGVEAGWGEAIIIEAATALVRGAVLFLPAGLGAQELTYASLLAAFGYPEATTLSATFISLKRGRELFWVAAGYTLLAVLRFPVRAAGRAVSAP